MDKLPKDIENIIKTYVNELNHYEKFKYVIKDINENLEIEYLIPYWDADTGYMLKNVKYKNEDFKRFSVILCYCCGRDIQITSDEYMNDIEEEDVELHLEQIEHSIMKDIWKGRCEKIIDYNEKTYLETRNKVFDQQNGYVLGRIELDNGNEYQILIDEDGEVEIIDSSDEENIIIDLTNSDIEELLDELEDELEELEEEL